MGRYISAHVLNIREINKKNRILYRYVSDTGYVTSLVYPCYVDGVTISPRVGIQTRTVGMENGNGYLNR